MTLLRELIDIPESLPANRFVLKLSQGICDPETTLKEYVVTEQLVGCFDKALLSARQLRLRQKPLHGGAAPDPHR